MQAPIYLANWKMNLSLKGSVRLAQQYLEAGLGELTRGTLVVAPSLFALQQVSEVFKRTSVLIAAQDCSTKDGYGSYTGEVSAQQIAEIGIASILLGHSERRNIFHESVDQINLKIMNSLNNNLQTIVSISETASQKRDGRTKELLSHQLAGALKGIEANDCPMHNLVIAYEPLWAISTSGEHQVPDPTYVGDITEFIKRWLTNNCRNERAEQIPVIYGGSVEEGNAQDFLMLEGIEGLLIGTSSLDAHLMSRIILTTGA